MEVLEAVVELIAVLEGLVLQDKVTMEVQEHLVVTLTTEEVEVEENQHQEQLELPQVMVELV